MAETTLNIKRAPFRSPASVRVSTTGRVSVSEGSYRVLASLEYRGGAYRVLADLTVGGEAAQLRLFRFSLARQDEWLSERKLNLIVHNPELVPLVENIGDAEYILRNPVCLDETDASAVFGESGPPVM